jgi:hypothetical protein
MLRRCFNLNEVICATSQVHHSNIKDIVQINMNNTNYSLVLSSLTTYHLCILTTSSTQGLLQSNLSTYDYHLKVITNFSFYICLDLQNSWNAALASYDFRWHNNSECIYNMRIPRLILRHSIIKHVNTIWTLTISPFGNYVTKNSQLFTRDV